MTHPIASWPLSVPSPGAPSVVPPANPTAPLGLGTLTSFDFLGTGLVTPFRRDQKQDFANATGLDVLRSAVGQILGTIASSDNTSGELPWRDDFGSKILKLRHQNNDLVLRELARVYVIEALAWEPRIQLRAVTARKEIGDKGRPNILAVDIAYDFIDTASGNVIFADVQQTVFI